MYSKLPALFGSAPTKVIFEGVEPGSAEAQKLYHEHQAKITAFQVKARQSDALGDQMGSHMVQRMPDGGQMRYVNNGGLETLIVRLEPPEPMEEVIEEVEEPIEEPERPKPILTSVLAIDIIYYTTPLLVGNISTYTEVPVAGGEEGEVISSNRTGKWWDESTWTLQAGTTDPAGWLDAYYGVPPGTNSATQLTWFWPGDPRGIPFTEPYPPYLDNFSIDEGFPAPERLDDIVWKGVVDHGGTTIILQEWQISEDMVNYYALDEYTYFSTVNIVGLRSPAEEDLGGVAEADISEAISTDSERDKGALRAITSGSLAAIAREITLQDEISQDGMLGAGFAFVLPDIPPDTILDEDGAEAAQVKIDVYMASGNLSVSNAFPDAKDVQLDIDDPSYTYAENTAVEFYIQVREFDKGIATTTVGVDVASDRKHERWSLGTTTTGAKSGASTTDYEPSGRATSWGFLVGEDWEDTGGWPAEPQPEDAEPPASTTGRLLIEGDYMTATAASVSIADRKIPSEPKWDDPIEDMVKVATIVWTPAIKNGDPSKAEITPA